MIRLLALELAWKASEFFAASQLFIGFGARLRVRVVSGVVLHSITTLPVSVGACCWRQWIICDKLDCAASGAGFKGFALTNVCEEHTQRVDGPLGGVDVFLQSAALFGCVQANNTFRLFVSGSATVSFLCRVEILGSVQAIHAVNSHLPTLHYTGEIRWFT